MNPSANNPEDQSLQDSEDYAPLEKNSISYAIDELEYQLYADGFMRDEVSMTISILKYRYDRAFMKRYPVVPTFNGHNLSILGRLAEMEERYKSLKEVAAEIMDRSKITKQKNKALMILTAVLFLALATITSILAIR